MFLKLVHPIQWWVKQFFVTIMNNVTASQPAYSKSRKIAVLLKKKSLYLIQGLTYIYHIKNTFPQVQ